MATNLYFTQGRRSEQDLYEDLIIESLKMYGQDLYYLPREIVNRDTFFDDDNVSRFDNAYRIEMYIENTEGFDGEGDLFTKFGVEIRDAATFIVSRRRFGNEIAQFESSATRPFHRPREGDLIFLPLSSTFFEITRVETEQPFYQLKDLPVFKMRAEMFEYNDEDFDTGVEVIDQVEAFHAQQLIITFSSKTGEFEIGEIVEQGTRRAEITHVDYSQNKIFLAHMSSTGSTYSEWNTDTITGQSSGATCEVSSVGEDLQDGAMNDDFNTVSQGGVIDFMDFSESNPFGDP